MNEAGGEQAGSRIAENLIALGAAADREIAAAAARSASFESRAIGIFSLSLGVPTLYLLVREPLSLAARAGELIPSIGLWIGAICAVLALVAGAVVAWPISLSVLGPVEVTSLHRQVATEVWVEGRLINERVSALRDALRINQIKGGALIASLILTIVCVIGFGLATFAALPATP